MSDLIDRQAAIDELVKMLLDCFQADEELVDAVATTIKELPSAQPERKGTWNRLSDDTFHCRECGTTFIVMQGEDHMNYCPNCGADMRGE